MAGIEVPVDRENENEEDEEEEVDYSWTPAKDEKEKRQGWEDGAAEAEDGLYGNLFVDGGLGESLLRLKAGELEERTQTLESENIRLTRENMELRDERDQLKGERDVLARNISCLFKTAKLEIDRKNDEVRQLQAAMRKLTLPGAKTIS